MYPRPNYVSKEVLTQVFQIIKYLQKKSPREPVTKKQVSDIIKKPTYTKPKLSYRHVGRAFQKLVAEKKIIPEGERGQYWLPEYRDKTLEYQKKQLELEKEFWGTVTDLTSKKNAELQQKLLAQDRDYEDIMQEYERREILEELRKKDLRASKKK